MRVSPGAAPITVTDMFLRSLQIVASSSDSLIGSEVSATPPASPANGKAPAGGPTKGGAVRSPDVAALRSQLTGDNGSAKGSNGIAIGSRDTANADGMVLVNPHFPWDGENRFWMAQLTVPGQYNVEGGTLYGFPLMGLGFNQDLAWTHTVSTDQRFTFYQLKLVPGHPTSYYVNGKAYKMGTETVRVDTGKATVSHTFYTTRWGTVMVFPAAGYTWTTTKAYTVDDAALGDGARFADQYLRMGQATSVEGLLKVESTYLAIPEFNTLAADDTGHVLYADVGNVPDVPLSLIRSCLPAGVPRRFSPRRASSPWMGRARPVPGAPAQARRCPAFSTPANCPIPSAPTTSRTRTTRTGWPTRGPRSRPIRRPWGISAPSRACAPASPTRRSPLVWPALTRWGRPSSVSRPCRPCGKAILHTWPNWC